MIVSFTLILLAQLVGEVLARATALSVPGPVIGMALLLLFMVLRDRWSGIASRVLAAPLVDGTLERSGKGLLAHLSLMFIPAGAGIVGRLDVLEAHGVALACVVVVSTLATLTATALTFVAVKRWVAPVREP
ncbi:CidA/LrgA family protein [Methylobacterium sp. SD274]|uniref:CidA/LrgA family protein n=1 Tax=Methylobacterium sp. SD274 TaxID=2782009 RepID=UPI001A979388|nr:CidA/LrgA family protein [Methylobacterium sp. SD274]MBO1022603.1 CidA/LrgA family protein [Methylobacterium sp. SD274]